MEGCTPNGFSVPALSASICFLSTYQRRYDTYHIHLLMTVPQKGTGTCPLFTFFSNLVLTSDILWSYDRYQQELGNRLVPLHETTQTKFIPPVPHHH